MSPMDPMMQDPMQAMPEGPMPDQRGLMDEASAGAIDDVLDTISDYLHSDARDQVAQAIAAKEAPLDETVAAIAYSTLVQAVDQVEATLPDIVEMDNLFYLATETIDFLLEIADAVGVEYDPTEVREKSFIELLQLHMAAMDGDPEQEEIARQMLAEMSEDGTLDEAMGYINQRGGDPEQMEQMAGQMMQEQMV